MDIELPIETPLTRRNGRIGYSRQDLLNMSNLFKKIESCLAKDSPRHLSLCDFLVSECSVRLAEIPPRQLYFYLAKRSGNKEAIDRVLCALNFGKHMLQVILPKAKRKISRVKIIVGNSVLNDFLDQHTEELMRSLEDDIIRERLEYNKKNEWCRSVLSGRAEPPKPATSFFYISDGYDRLH